MGWLDKLFKKNTKSIIYADTLNGYTPIFSQFGQNIFASDVVQQAINCIVQEMKKLQPTHILKKNKTEPIPISGQVQNILDNPNSVMTTADFIEKIIWLLFFNYNAFIIPTYYLIENKNGTQKKIYTGLYPVQPSQVDFIQDNAGVLAIKMRFANGYETTLDYSDVIHIRYKYSVNEFMGGNESGQPDNEALLRTLNLNNDLLTGVSRAIKASYAINGVIKYNTLMEDSALKENLKELEKKLANNESGFLPLDLKGEFIPIENKSQLVDEETLKFIDTKILRHYGVPLCILLGDYTKAQYEAFYQKTLEPLIVTLSQAFTKALFSSNQLTRGNEIQFYPKDLIFMTVEQKLEMVRLLGDSGSLYENEKRVAFGLKPLSELEGVRMQSLNYVNTSIAEKYQLSENNENGGKNENENEK